MSVHLDAVSASNARPYEHEGVATSVDRREVSTGVKQVSCGVWSAAVRAERNAERILDICAS